MKLLLGRLLLVGAILVLWDIAASTIADEFFISRPLVVAEKFSELVTSGRLFYHGWITVVETLGGFVSTTMGRIPEPGASFERNGVRYTTIDAEPQRINHVRIEQLAPAPAPATTSATNA